MNVGLSSKRALIDKANSRVVIITAVATFVTVFSLVASKTLFNQVSYQNRVLGEKHKVLHQLQSDVKAAKDLSTQYQAFINTPENAIGGNPTGTGPQDGNNAKLVLDALPSTYDFPALVTSVEKMLDDQAVKTGSITGTDDEIAQSANTTSVTPQPIPIPFQASVTGDYAGVQAVVSALERSIRPFQLQTLSLSGGQDKLSLTITAQTYYQPAKSLNITEKVVK